VNHWRLEVFQWRDPEIGGEGNVLYALRYLEERNDQWEIMIERARELAADLIGECDG
jgi:hypothetical protein